MNWNNYTAQTHNGAWKTALNLACDVEFFREYKIIYLHFLSFPTIVMAQVSHPRRRQGLDYQKW